MPVVAQSGPLIFDSSKTPKPTKTPKPGTTPKPDVGTPPPNISTPEPGKLPLGPFAAKHVLFIDKINSLGSCFKRPEILGLTDQDFSDHIEIAKKDKFITQEKDLYCSLQAIARLKDSLDRTKDKREIL